MRMHLQRNRQCEGDVAIAWRAMELVAEEKGKASQRRSRDRNASAHHIGYVPPQNIVSLRNSWKSTLFVDFQIFLGRNWTCRMGLV